jgi:hypothetical protein
MKKKMAEVELHTQHVYTSVTLNRTQETPGKDSGNQKQFEVWLENQKEEEKSRWDPFASEEEWALTMWLLKNVGQMSTDQFLKLPIVR